MKKLWKTVLSLTVAAVLFAACTPPEESAAPIEEDPAAEENEASLGEITVVSREDGSGTRGAFIELMGVLAEGEGGTETDMTTMEAIIANKTDVMISNVTNTPAAVGYLSLGSLNDTVKALNIDGVAPTSDNVKNGTYAIARPFNIATKGEPEGVTKDFIDFILSQEGQTVVSDGYIPVSDAPAAYAGTQPAGKIVVGGSSSVTPVMELLKEAYLAVNPNAEIEIQMSDSTAGMTGAIDGTFQIGMASRDLNKDELAQLTPTAIAIDGIAVIVNPENPATDLTSGQVRAIFTGETTSWDQLQ